MLVGFAGLANCQKAGNDKATAAVHCTTGNDISCIPSETVVQYEFASPIRGVTNDQTSLSFSESFTMTNSIPHLSVLQWAEY